MTSTKQFIASEERDASGSVTKKFSKRGVVIGGTTYFYERDHLGSVRQLCDSSGNVVSAYYFRPYGEKVTLSEAVPSDMQYAGYYFHARSGLSLTANRAYAPSQSAWLSRDPMGEDGGNNLYAYVGGNPISRIDPLGLTDFTESETHERYIVPATIDASGSTLPYGFGQADVAKIRAQLLIAHNSATKFDFGHNGQAGDTFCVKGRQLTAFQFGNFLAGYQGQIWDDVNFPDKRAAGRVLAFGLIYHMFAGGVNALFGSEAAVLFSTVRIPVKSTS